MRGRQQLHRVTRFLSLDLTLSWPGRQCPVSDRIFSNTTASTDPPSRVILQGDERIISSPDLELDPKVLYRRPAGLIRSRRQLGRHRFTNRHRTRADGEWAPCHGSFFGAAVAPGSVSSLECTVSDSQAPRRFRTALIAAFAFAAILLAALGFYGVIAFSAALRTQEMAIRIALGSQRSGILRLVFTSAAKLAVAGWAVGLLGAAAASRLLRSFLFGVSRFDPLVLLLAAIFVLCWPYGLLGLPAKVQLRSRRLG
jgi:hypothetical protein